MHLSRVSGSSIFHLGIATLCGFAFSIYFIYTFFHQSPSSWTALVNYRQSHDSEIWYKSTNTSGHVWQNGLNEEREDILFDGVRRFVRQKHLSRPNLLFLVLTQDEASWGADNRQPARTFHDFLDLIASTGLDLSQCSLGIMTASESEYNSYRNITASTPLARTTIHYKKPNENPKDLSPIYSKPRGGRHADNFQYIRRANIALLRNELQSRTLADEQHVIWIDSDVKFLSPNIVQTMIHHSTTNPTASIITSLCNTSWWVDYDKNAFQGWRSPPNPYQSSDTALAQSEADLDPKVKYVGDLHKLYAPEALIPLDSVGGTLLYMRASLIHQGLHFTPYYAIGTRWGMDGWDGLETEGLCYLASYLDGGACWALGSNYYTTHTGD